MDKVEIKSFCVMGKVGSSENGEGFVQKLWQDANEHFEEIAAYAKKDADGNLVALWGAMTNYSFEFRPWEDNFTKGLYLAGVECEEDAVAPKGWKKWIVPGFECVKVLAEGPDTISNTLAKMKEEGLELVAAMQDYTDPKTQTNYILFPYAWNDSKQKLIQSVKARTNQMAVCGFYCDHCFMTEWCGGCRSGCNMCSFATCSEDNVCENVSCAKAKNFDSCSECPELRDCTKGFYITETGFTAKGSALFIHEYGDAKYIEVLNKMRDAGVSLNDMKTTDESVEMLKKYL